MSKLEPTQQQLFWKKLGEKLREFVKLENWALDRWDLIVIITAALTSAITAFIIMRLKWCG